MNKPNIKQNDKPQIYLPQRDAIAGTGLPGLQAERAGRRKSKDNQRSKGEEVRNEV